MIQNLDTRLNKLQTQCDYLRRKISAFPEGELSIQKYVSEKRNNLYIVLNQIVLLQRLWP